MSALGRPAFLTVDVEDYRRHGRRDATGREQRPCAAEVQRQLDATLELLDELSVRATFFVVAELVHQLPQGTWTELLARGHQVGCHGLEHRRVDCLGPALFREHLNRARHCLCDALGTEVLAYRSPYFSAEDCLPWAGELLAEAGFSVDSSMRCSLHGGPLAHLPGSDGAVREVPLASLGSGPKRLTVMGGTYLRLLPTEVCARLLDQAAARSFTPMVYLHPYDLDAAAPSLGLNPWRLCSRAGDRMRRTGRLGLPDKLRRLSERFDFGPLLPVGVSG